MRGLTTTIILIVVLAGLGGYIYYDSRHPSPDAEAKAKAFTVTADQIEELQIQVEGGDTTRVSRADGSWRLVEPVRADADNAELTNIASNLASLEIERVVDEKPADLTQYGLNPPKIQIAFREKGKTDLVRLLVGEKTPTGGGVYAKKPNEPGVFLVSSALDDTFRRSTFDLRDKTVLKFDREKVDAIEITGGRDTIRFARAGSDWLIEKPARMRADYSAVEGILTTLQGAAMQKLVAAEATPAELKTAGLTTPSVTASVLTGSARATLVLGRNEEGETFARDSSRPMLMTVPGTVAAELTKPVDDFRRKDLFDMRSFTASQLEIKRGNESFAFEKYSKDGGDAWKNAAGKDVDTAKVEDLLTKLSSLRIQTFAKVEDPALRAPLLTVTVRFGEGKDKARTETATLAKAGNTLVASRPDEPGTLTLEAATLDEVTTALDSVK